MNTLKTFLFLIIDILLLTLIFFFNVWILKKDYGTEILPYYIINRVFFFYVFRLYYLLSKYVNIKDIIFIFYSMILSSFTGYLFLIKDLRFTIIDFLMVFFVISISRIIPRTFQRFLNRTDLKKKILIYGAGDAGDMICSEIMKHPEYGIKIIGFIDDDHNKKGKYINNYKIFGNRKKIEKIIKKYGVDEILVAIPSAKSEVIDKIHEEISEYEITIKMLPSENDLIDGTVTLEESRDYDVKDIIRRSPNKRDVTGLKKLISGKTLLITGAGGSIGSELVRQLLKFNPSKLILTGHGENSLFQLNKIIASKKDICEIVLCDIQDKEKIENVFIEFKPEIVFHAAAHKHVFMLEKNVDQGIMNNIKGSDNIFDISGKYGVKKVVLISTDKAVEPTSVMGMTKRVVEKLSIAYGNKYKNTFYISVRFGNVLGSRGSIVPIFKNQIKKGGPLTVTHPEVNRFFMTIPEAVQLIMEAVVIGKSSDIFVLDMGESIKIKDIALKMIELSGREDIKIIYTGLKKGEKLREKLFNDFEKKKNTENSKIFIAEHIDVDIKVIEDAKELVNKTYYENEEVLLERLKRLSL